MENNFIELLRSYNFSEKIIKEFCKFILSEDKYLSYLTCASFCHFEREKYVSFAKDKTRERYDKDYFSSIMHGIQKEKFSSSDPITIISHSFMWAATPEGYDRWDETYHKWVDKCYEMDYYGNQCKCYKNV